MQERFVDLFTDYGFKKIFGEEANIELLIDFLNALLREYEGEIVSLTIGKTEQLDQESGRRPILDISCTNEKGERFHVEMQKKKQKFYKDRMAYYATFLIREQAQASKWNYELKPVYTISILDFEFDEGENNPHKYRYDIKLMDKETCKVFYDKQTFIYLEMPKFNSQTTLEQCKTRLEQWLYLLANLNSFTNIPEQFRGDKIFRRVFEVAEIAKFNFEQLRLYEDSLKYYRDLNNTFTTVKEEGKEEGLEEGLEKGMEKGKEEGRAEGIENTAVGLLKSEVSEDVIMKSTGLTAERLQEIKKNTACEKRGDNVYSKFSIHSE